MQEITTGTLLGGRVGYRQFAGGHRTGFEPVLLAAAVPAEPGDSVLEAGTGAGAGVLCLAARVPELACIGAEIDPGLAQLAQENFIINRLKNGFAVCCDICRPPFPAQKFDHILANPPWCAAETTASPDPKRSLAHHAPEQQLEDWIAVFSRLLRPQGSLTLILPASRFTAAAAWARARKFGAITLVPLWPRAGAQAKLILLTARKSAKGPDRITPGLILHDANGISDAAQAILRDGAMLAI